MINSKITKVVNQPQSTEEKVLKYLEGIDWKLWEMMNMMKKDLDATRIASKKSSSRKSADDEE